MLISDNHMTLISIGCGLIGLSLVLLCTLSSAYLLGPTYFTRKGYTLPAIYEDKDGVATEETTAAYSTKIPKIIICILSLLGFGVSTALAVFGTVSKSEGFFTENWLNVASWFLLIIQASCIVFSKVPITTYELGITASISCWFLLAVIFTQYIFLSQSQSDIGPIAPFALRISQLALVILIAVANLSIPRRPAVFINGEPVDAMRTESALSRYTFAWVVGILDLSAKKKTLDLEDLPRPDSKIRSREVTESWIKASRKGSLLRKVVLAHKGPLVIQWLLTLLQAFGNFAPQFVLFHILRILEKRQEGKSVTSEAWIWILALGLSTIVSSWVENWLFWVSQYDVAIPIRAQLSALVFRKSMRRKDVKGAAKKDEPDATINVDNLEEPAPPPPVVEEDDEEDPLQKSRQAIVNLIGVDTKRISDFAGVNYFFPSSTFKLLISFWFLIDLLGWKALLAGLATMAIILPINIYFSKRYSDAQDRLMKARDAKLAVVNEALQGMKQIKWTATEKQWQAKIGRARNRELKELWSSLMNDTGLLLCWMSSPVMLSAASLATYAWIYGQLTPSVAFTSIGIFKQLEVTLSVIPELTTNLLDALVSFNRIDEYLHAPEITPHRKDAPTISFDNASVAWPSDETRDASEHYILRSINISFPDKELSVISGKTGSGKSLLLSSILGETDLLSGTIYVPTAPSLHDRYDSKATKENWIIPSAIAYVAQIPWIENATVKNNILFGLPYDEYRYKKTLEVCALEKDLDIMTDGDETEIGANGINLSGGQRWRLTFARALYSRAGILVLDDLFSALDAHVGRYIFENGLTGELGVGRTRILVTHHVALCKPRTKYLVELSDGTVENAGFLSELESEGLLTKIINHVETANEIQLDEDATVVNSEESSDSGESNSELLAKVKSKGSLKAKKFVEDEGRETGAINKKIYFGYLKSSGGWSFWGLALLIFATQQTLTLGRSWILRLWTGSASESSIRALFTQAHQTSESSIRALFTQAHQIPSASASAFRPSEQQSISTLDSADDQLLYYLTLYVLVSVITSLLGTFRFYYVFTGSMRASRRLFDSITFTVLRTPLRWIDTVPLGRILNRFTADFNVVDARLAYDLSFGASNLFQLVGIVIAGLFISRWILLLALTLALICLYYAYRYLLGAREVKRLESNAKSPIFETFNATLSGVATIRSFNVAETYISRMYHLIDTHSTITWHLWLFNRWMGLRMGIVGAFFAVTMSSIIVMLPNIDAGLAGFALAFGLEYTWVMIWALRHYANLELSFNSAERVIEYSNLPIESQDGIDPPAAWPSQGRLQVEDLVAGYAPDLPAVLQGLSFSVEPGQRVGVVGRTGAGKSSLTLALFRFLEAREGQITIDGLDIAKVKLHSLRSRLAIIPQDPVLFSGTVRSNLDPFEEHSDVELYDALMRVHLIDSAPTSRNATPPRTSSGEASPTSQNSNANTNIFRSLSSPISESGLNLSQGQRQLLCLARAIVSRPKILILDEATSAVDMETDALIQRSIREEFVGSGGSTGTTLLVIAHRIATIRDFDRVLVMQEGKGVEYGPPEELIRLENGVFRSLVEGSGEGSGIKKELLGKGVPVEGNEESNGNEDGAGEEEIGAGGKSPEVERK